MAIFMIRPGETDYDIQNRLQGRLNLPLTERGMTQVDDVIGEVRDAGIDRIYSGPNEPALSSAKRIATELDVPLKILDDLANVDLGLWQGLCVSEIRNKQPRVFRQWEECPGSVCPPHGEAGTTVCDRVAAALKKPLKKGGCFAIVASEPLASLIECQVRGETPDLSDSFDQRQHTGSWREIVVEKNGHSNGVGHERGI